jgi:hypothetical protein
MTNEVSAASARDTGKNGFFSALVDDEPSPELGDADIYGWLVGSWDMEVIDYDDDGAKHKSRGEWHFARVLEGRAIQDVFVVPRRGERNTATAIKGNRYGCSLRVYDQTFRAWKVRWNNPVTGAENYLIGKRLGDAIIQEGTDKDGTQFRWIFNEIALNSFHWYGERSFDGGKTWTLEVEFFGMRMAS